MTLNYEVSINGKICEANEQYVSVFNRGLLFGHAVFETLLCLESGMVFWKEHYSRLLKSSQFSRISCPSQETLKAACENLISHTIQKTNAKRFSLRILLTAGNSASLKIQRQKEFENKLPESEFILYCAPTDSPTELSARGLNVFAFPDARNQKLVSVKSNNYLWNTIALDEALVKGYDDALLIGEDLELLELTTANFVWVCNDNLWYTTPSEGLCLPGTTLIALKASLAKYGISLQEKLLKLSQLNQASNCYAISSVRGLVPIAKINQTEFKIEHDMFYQTVNSTLIEIQKKSALL